MLPTVKPTGTAAHSGVRTVGTIPFVLLMAVLPFVFLVGKAGAQEVTGGVEAGDGEVSINGGEVYARDGCAKAGDVVAGNCDGKSGDAE